MEQDELSNSSKVQKTMRTCILTSISLQMVCLILVPLSSTQTVRINVEVLVTVTMLVISV